MTQKNINPRIVNKIVRLYTWVWKKEKELPQISLEPYARKVSDGMNWSEKQSSGVKMVWKSFSECPSISKLVRKFAPAEEF
jgi:hypothetical protein